jgi:ABC-type multidrug transport system fused ATPase/permease subunit
MKETEDRIQQAKVERLKELTNAFIEANGGQFKLHPGFDKICGLKGSKLSGGQK